MFNLKWQTKNK